MTSVSDELQRAVFGLLTTDIGVTDIVGQRVFDRRPDPGPGSQDFPCVTFGPSSYVPDDSDCITGRVETMQIDCWVRESGRVRGVRVLVDAVKQVLHGVTTDLATHALLELRVTLTRAFMDPDGLTAHGVVHVEAIIEEA